jgi:hypothetical protein
MQYMLYDHSLFLAYYRLLFFNGHLIFMILLKNIKEITEHMSNHTNISMKIYLVLQLRFKKIYSIFQFAKNRLNFHDVSKHERHRLIYWHSFQNVNCISFQRDQVPHTILEYQIFKLDLHSDIVWRNVRWGLRSLELPTRSTVITWSHNVNSSDT